MASLKFIMDVDDDDQEPHQNIRDKDSAPAPPSSRPEQPPPTSQPSYPSHVSSSPTPAAESNLNPAVVAAHRGTRPNPSSSRPPTNEPATPPPSSLYRSSARRRSTTSTDSMDQAGYASAASSSSRGTGPAVLNNPMRPMPSPAGADIPVKFTPITGRVSRARKGVPVHTCDLCKPPKTFTRAEHLRRHQLSHQTPGYPCTYPGCDRSFHRPDLLSRHQQRHEQEGDKVERAGDDDSRQLSLEESLPRLGLQPQTGSSPVMPAPGMSPAPGSSAADTPSTPNTSANAPAFQQLRSPGGVSSPSFSPHHGGTGHYNFSPGGSHEYQYSPSPSLSAMSASPNHDGSPMGAPTSYPRMAEPYQQPRSTPSIFVVTQGLSLPSLHIPDAGPPDLCHPDASPWASSASDSTYSTPASDISRNHRYWMPRHRSPTADWPSAQLLSPYPNTVPRETQSPGPSLEDIAGAPTSLFVDTFPPSSHSSTTPQNEAFGAVLDVPMSSFGSTGAMPSPTSAGTFRPHHQQHDSVTSLHSPTSPHVTSTHAAGALVTPMRALPDRINAMASLGRQKEMVVDVADAQHAFMSAGGGGGAFDILGGLDRGLGDGGGGGGQGGMGCENGVLTTGLPLNDGCGLLGAPSPSPLPRMVRAAIPGYIKVYWRRFHRLYPIVHRRSFEVTGDDVLRCAMAAVATQYLDSKEDRVKGNQLHEYAWQEAKRIPQWNLQVLQAILLCELFARFRGRKAVTRPSKQFESLYSRVLYHNPTMFDPAVVSPEQHLPLEDRWQAWLDAEARRRLLTACFIVDVHTSVYQQQRRAQEYDLSGTGGTPPIPLTARSAALWEASSAEDWARLLSRDPEAGNPTFIPVPSDALTPEDVSNRPEFDRAAVLALELLRLPRRPSDTGGVGDATPDSAPTADFPPFLCDDTPDFDMDFDLPTRVPAAAAAAAAHHSGSDHNDGSSATTSDAIAPAAPLPSPAEERLSRLFAAAAAPSSSCARANAYLALHHTPLHDLLAVSGDTWIFSHKVLPATSFVGHQSRLRAWADQQQDAGSATVYAARAILGFLAGTENNSDDDDGPAACMSDISDYWALYACALVCWAFGQATAARPGEHVAGDAGRAGGGDGEALVWLRMVAGAETGAGDAAAWVGGGRREAGGVVRLVRRRLEGDCVGGRSRLYVDAVGVLKKLEEGANWKWF